MAGIGIMPMYTYVQLSVSTLEKQFESLRNIGLVAGIMIVCFQMREAV
jgi:hypothetical protein